MNTAARALDFLVDTGSVLRDVAGDPVGGGPVVLGHVVVASLALGYLAAAFMGATLGMIGAGGSILTVPILVYAFGVHPVVATAYSLFVVGLTALVGSIGYLRAGLVDFRAVGILGLPSLAGVFLVRRYLIPNVPDVIWRTDSFVLTKGLLVMIAFAVVMVLAAASMIHRPRPERARTDRHVYVPLAIAEGFLVGGFTGFVGAGGGFLLVPSLVVLLRLPVKLAIGTSLVVIALKSLLGFAGDPTVASDLDWSFLAVFSAVAALGIAFGVALNGRVPEGRLKPIFGWFVLLMGAGILLKEVLL